MSLKDSHAQSGFGPNKLVFWGMVSLFLVQLGLQGFSLFFHGDFKGGLINSRMLLWQGLQVWPVVKAMLYSLAVYSALLYMLSVTSFLAARLFVRLVPVRESVATWMIINLLLLFACLLVINVYHYPNSLVRLALVSELQADNIKLPYYAGVTVCLGLLAIALAELLVELRNWWLTRSRSARGFVAVGCISCLVVVAFVPLKPELALTQPGNAKSGSRAPNVILIGLDSVRLDIIEDKELRELYMPNLSEFLADRDTAWFTNTYTPIARTFAAWYALLSGREPKKSGVRYNLQQVSQTQKSDTIVGRFRNAGYYTVYGSDEKRFSAIDESFGFHLTFGPPPGAAEWLLSLLEDTPIHNILRETPLAAYLLPHTYGNRATQGVYKPEHFVALMNNWLEGYEQNQPLFLSVHLCLSHWPYAWSESGADGAQSGVHEYLGTLGPLDKQFGEILDALNDAGLLRDSVVVVFTDHGEGLASGATAAGSGKWDDAQAGHSVFFDRTAGHGNDLLTITQNQILVSMKDNTGQAGIPGGQSKRFTSLLDIAPTLARIAGLEALEIDGVDLAETDSSLLEKRRIFLETGFNPVLFEDAEMEVEELVRQGASAYEISDQGLLQVRQEFHDRILADKEKGVTDGRFIVSTGPGSHRPGSTWAEINAIDVANPNMKLTKADIETNAQLSYLKSELERYYGDEL